MHLAEGVFRMTSAIMFLFMNLIQLFHFILHCFNSLGPLPVITLKLSDMVSRLPK